MGDKWTFEHIDRFDASKSETRVQTVASAGADGIVLKTEGSKLGVSESHYSPDWLLHKRVMPGSAVRLHAPPLPEFKFPMAVGSTWPANTSYTNPNGSKVEVKGESKVVRVETLELAGKRWDTLVIQTETTFQVTPGPYGHYAGVRWYAPAARSVVKYEDSVARKGRVVDQSSGELTAITLQD